MFIENLLKNHMFRTRIRSSLAIVILVCGTALATDSCCSSPMEGRLEVSLWYDRMQDMYSNTTSQGISTYSEYLLEWPVLTKSTTSGLIGGLGDILAQTFEILISGTSAEYDFQRALAVSLEGLLISGPMLHYSYDFLEDMLPVGGDDMSNLVVWIMVILQVVIDTLILDTFFVGTLMIATAILEGRIRYVASELRDEFWNGVKVSWASSVGFLPLQCLLVRHVPISYRVLATNLQDIIWNASVSYVAHRSRKSVVKED